MYVSGVCVYKCRCRCCVCVCRYSCVCVCLKVPCACVSVCLGGNACIHGRVLSHIIMHDLARSYATD